MRCGFLIDKMYITSSYLLFKINLKNPSPLFHLQIPKLLPTIFIRLANANAVGAVFKDLWSVIPAFNSQGVFQLAGLLVVDFNDLVVQSFNLHSNHKNKAHNQHRHHYPKWSLEKPSSCRHH